MPQAQPAPETTAYVQPTQAPAFSNPCSKPEATLIEVTNFLTRQQVIAKVADGTPCCYRTGGKAYSSTYKDDQCQATTALACFRFPTPEEIEAWSRRRKA